MTHRDSLATERTLGRLLNVGTRASTLMLAVGLALELTRAGGVASWLLHVGLLVLFATPVLRVAVSIVTFAARREWRFVVFTSIVLLLLISGILVAIDA
jgi:uncharacterized membrane protein